MIDVTFICGTPCNASQVAALKKAGYEPQDAVRHLLSSKYGDKMFEMRDGNTVRV